MERARKSSWNTSIYTSTTLFTGEIITPRSYGELPLSSLGRSPAPFAARQVRIAAHLGCGQWTCLHESVNQGVSNDYDLFWVFLDPTYQCFECTLGVVN